MSPSPSLIWGNPPLTQRVETLPVAWRMGWTPRPSIRILSVSLSGSSIMESVVDSWVFRCLISETFPPSAFREGHWFCPKCHDAA